MGAFDKMDKLKSSKTFRVLLGTSAIGVGATGTALATGSDSPKPPQTASEESDTGDSALNLEGSEVAVESDEEILQDLLDDDTQNADLSPDSPATPDSPASPATPETPESPATPESPVSPATPETPDSPASPESAESPDSPASPESPDSPETPDSPDDDDEDDGDEDGDD